MLKKHRIAVLVLFITIIVVSVLKLWPETKAETKSKTSIEVTFSPGEKAGAFDNKTYILEVNKTNNYVTIPNDFKTTIDMLEESYYKKVDDETFYFDEGDYSYTFTGWKIKGATKYIPMETVFQPGDIVDYNTLNINENETVELEAIWGKVIYAQNEYTGRYYTDYWIYDKEYTEKNYTATGAWNYKYEDEKLILNNGQDLENPVSSVDYAYYLFYQQNYNNELSNIEDKNAYSYVIMLTGDLDYIKSNDNGKNQEHYFRNYDIYDGKNYDSTKNYIFGNYTAQQNFFGYASGFSKTGTLAATFNGGNIAYSPSITFKSYNNAQYYLYINGYGYYDSVYNSIRFDGIYYKAALNTKRPQVTSPVTVGSETAFLGGVNTCLEFTQRANASGFSVLRTNCVQTVVFNGGTFPSWQTSWSSDQKVERYDYELHWYMGQKAQINDEITLGTTARYENSKSVISQNFEFTITGGYVKNIYGGSYGMNSTSMGQRKIKIIGDKGTNRTTNPIITNVYGTAKSGKFIGESYINIIGATDITNVYGGGCDFTATTYGNTHINIENSIVKGDIYGGGYNGNVRKKEDLTGGNVDVNIKASTILGNIFGSGTGGTQTINVPIRIYKNQDEVSWQENQYIPTDEDFQTIKNADNGDYNTDWSWNKPATGFPFIQENTEYICIAIYKEISWVSNNPTSITFTRTYTYAYLSLALVENDVNIVIDGSIIGTKGDTSKGNVYGGGSLAKVEGNTYVTVKNNSIIYNSVYGGGDGITKPSEVEVYYSQDESTYTAPKYTVVKDSKGNIVNVKCESEYSEMFKYVYKNKFTWSNDQILKDTNGINTNNYTIYSPNENDVGVIEGNTQVIVENSNVTGDVLAGGKAADVQGNCNLTISNSTITDVYGGGYSGNVIGNTEVQINSGKMQNVFGGGNLGTIKSNTTVTVGDESNSNLEISNLLYGGGKGYDADNDGDASDFITVYGTATVEIQGINTYVENYGSITLGAVQKNIDVTFKNYWTGNSTAKYKTMNGIDRATNVYFQNSYVLLTNKDNSGNLLGIKSIENLYIPDGSGLKISAEGEISGNFEGGGELYLDSEVCLTVRGNITGKTTLVLNPLMYENESYKIKGGEENPYLKVYGTIPEETKTNIAKALVSGDTQYEIVYKNEDGFTIYYIDNDIVIDKNLTEEIILQEDKKFSNDTTNWKTNSIQITQDGSISGDFKISYQFKKDENLEKKYQNLKRSIIIKSGEEQINIPQNTQLFIIDLKDESTEIYKYNVKEEQQEINIKNFENINNSKNKYGEISNIVSKATGNDVTQMYTYDERFRIIMDFSNCKDYLEAGKTYNVLLKIQDTLENIKEPEYSSINIMSIYPRRQVSYDGKIDKTKYNANEKININGTIKMTGISENTVYDIDENKNLDIKIKLQNENGENITIPEGVTVSINGEEQLVNSNYINTKIFEITKENIEKQLNIQFCMNNVIQTTQKLKQGKYKIIVEAYTQEGNTLKRKMMEKAYEFEIIEKSNFGIDAAITNDSENADKLQLFNSNINNKNLTIKVQKGDLEEPKIKIELQKRVSSFKYTDIENTILAKSIENADLQEENTLRINGKLETGTYRIVIKLLDKYNVEYSKKELNFIVE